MTFGGGQVVRGSSGEELAEPLDFVEDQPFERSPQVCRCIVFIEKEFFIDNLLVRIHFIIVMIRWTGLAPWEFEFPFSGSLTSTFHYVHTRSALGDV